MANQMDGRFAKRRSYSLAGRGFVVKLSATNAGTWHCVFRSADGKVAGLNFADENAALTYCRQKNFGAKLQYVADPTAAQPAYLDVESAKAEMLENAPRKGDPRVATTAAEATRTFQYSEREIEQVNESILDSYLERHSASLNNCNINTVVISRALDDHLASNPGAILNDALITSVVNALAQNKMLVTGKRGETVQPYRRLSEVAQTNEQARLEAENNEALRRRSLPLEEQRELLNQEGLKLGGSTVNRSATSTTQSTQRSNANRGPERTDEDNANYSMPLEDLAAIERNRQAEARRRREGR
jgi:hypothetical protein